MAANGVASSGHKRLAGKVAIVTGGASGIGETTVRLFVEHGAKVIIADIQDAKGEKLASQLGPTTAYAHCNVLSDESVEATVALAVERFGKLDIMFNNAGISWKRWQTKVTEMEMSEFDDIMAVNVRGTALGLKYGGKAMVEGGRGGVILCTASVVSALGGLAPPAYTASKHAILGLVKAAASDLGKHGIRVNSISPFLVPTPLTTDLYDELGVSPEVFCDRFANLHGHCLSTLDVAHSALFLASDDALYVSGHNLFVDGGFTVTNHCITS